MKQNEEIGDHNSEDRKNCPPQRDPPPVVDEQASLALLPPDHPLLENFQRSLKEYLLRSKSQLINDIDDIKYNLKNKQRQREDEGAKMFDLQTELQRQNEQLEELAAEIHQKIDERHKKEDAVVELKAEYEAKVNLTKEQKMIYNKQMVELEHMQVLENNMHKWVDEVENEVKTAKRVVNRDTQLEQQMAEQKRKAELLFYHLNVEVKKRENELELLSGERKDMKSIIDILNLSISNGNADLEALQLEHMRLNQAWNDVIVAIQHRDKIMHQVDEATRKEHEFIKLTDSSIVAIKRLITKEMDQNEKLESFKTRLANDLIIQKKECQKQSDILHGLETKLEELPAWLHRTEMDLNEAIREGNKLEVEIRRILRKIDKQSILKFNIEENILKLAQDQLLTDKASKYRLKLLRSAQDRRRSDELTLAQCKHQLSEFVLDLEKQKGLVFKINTEKDSLNKTLAFVESKSDIVNTELKTLQYEIKTKLVRMDILARKLDVLKQGDQDAEASPTEIKIKALEKALHAAEHQVREHQQFWLMLQHHYINLSQKRNEQLNEIQVTNKQLKIIKQKSLEIDYDLEMAEKLSRELNHDMKLHKAKVEMLNEKMFLKRRDHEIEESGCELEHQELVEKLKDNEMEVLALESEINELQVDIEHYKDLVLDKHREALSWETKYKMIDETLRWRKEERDRNSEIGIMKAEIHRMQLRYEQLKRAQEKLVEDLKQSVMHRENIFVHASTKQVMDAKPQNKKATIRQKVAQCANKLKMIHNEIDLISNQHLIECCNELQCVRDKIQKIQSDIQDETEGIEYLLIEIDEAALLKHRNLEKIICTQNRAKSYRQLQAMASPKLPRSKTTIEQLWEKKVAVNKNMLDVIHTIMEQYPERKNILVRVSQMLMES